MVVGFWRALGGYYQRALDAVGLGSAFPTNETVQGIVGCLQQTFGEDCLTTFTLWRAPLSVGDNSVAGTDVIMGDVSEKNVTCLSQLLCAIDGNGLLVPV